MYIVSSVICLIGAIIIRLYQDFLISISHVAYNANHNVYIYLLFSQLSHTEKDPKGLIYQ